MKREMNVCFISNNDITGGNSGSAMFNAKENFSDWLLTAIGKRWAVTSSMNQKMQRCIGVDVLHLVHDRKIWQGRKPDTGTEDSFRQINGLYYSPDTVVKSGQRCLGAFSHSYDNLLVGHVGYVSCRIYSRNRGTAECVRLDFTGRRFQYIAEKRTVGCQAYLYEDAVQWIVTLFIGNTVLDADTGYFFAVAFHPDGFVKRVNISTLGRLWAFSCRIRSAFSVSANSKTVTSLQMPARSMAASMPEFPPPMTATCLPW